MAAEGNIVGEVGLIVKPVDPGFDAGVKKIISRLERDAKFKVGADTQEAQKAVENLANSAGGIGRAWQQSALEVVGFTAAVYASKRAVEQLVQKFSGLFDQLAQARAGFSSILKSEISGNKLLDEIREFARVSPFVTGELVNYSQQLLGVGKSAESIVPLLRSTGDIIASVGGDTQNLGRVLFALTQIQSMGRLQGQDAMQLQTALVPITKYLSQYLNKTTAEVKKLQEQGKISAETVFAAINQQGNKVKGAMDKATRNIAGARAILSDSIKILLQSQPALQGIFDNMFKGILKFSTFLEKPEIRRAIDEFFVSIGRIYVALKPLGAAMASIGGTIGLNGLKTFTSLLSTVAVVLEAIPQSAMKVIAAFLITVSALKAPLMLIRYINNFQTLAVGAFAAAKAQDGLTMSTERLEAAQKRALFASSKLAKGIQYAALAASMAGTIVQDGQGGARDAIGSMLQYGGMGAMIGMSGGAPGAAIGAGVGVAVGAVTSIISASAKATAAAKKAGEDAGKAYATAFSWEIEKQHRGDLTIDAALTQFFTEGVGQIQKGIRAYEYANIQFEAQRNKLAKGNTVGGGGRGGASGAAGIEIQRLNEKIAAGDAQIVQFHADLKSLLEDPKFAEIRATVTSKLAILEGDVPGLVPPANLNPQFKLDKGLTSTSDEQGIYQALIGQSEIDTPEKLAAVQKVLGGFNLTMEQFAGNTKEVNTVIIQTSKSLPAAFQAGSKAATDFNAQVLAAKTSSEAFFKMFEDEAKTIAANLNTVSETNAKFGGLIERNKQGVAVLKEHTSALEANAIGQQIQNRGQLAYQETLVRTNDGAKATNARLEAERGMFEILQSTLGLTDEKFKEMLVTAGLWNNYMATGAVATEVYSGSLSTLAANAGITTEAFAKLAGVDLTTLNPFTQFTYGKEGDEALKKYKELQDLLASGSGYAPAIIAAMHKIIDQFPELVIAINPAIAAAEEFWDKFIKGAREFGEQLNAQRTIDDSLGSLFVVNEDNAVVLGDNIKTQQDVVAGILDRAAALADKAFADGMNKIDAGKLGASQAWQEFELLQLTLKMTDEEFEKFLGLMGREQPAGSGVSGTFADVASKLNLSSEELAKYLGLQGEIDPNLEVVVTADASAAMAELDEYKRRKDIAMGHGVPFNDTKPPGWEESVQGRIDAGTSQGDPNKPPIDPDKADKDKKAREDELKRWLAQVENATDSLANKLQQAADNIAAAAERWVGSIKERTQYEQAVSTARLTKNAQSQVNDVAEMTTGLAALKGRGLTQETLDALGIDNIADLKQVRKLLKSSDADLATLSSTVAARDKGATDLAISEEDRHTRDNIQAGIVAAATELGYDSSKDNAAAIANQFNITPGMDAEAVAKAILAVLSGGAIG